MPDMELWYSHPQSGDGEIRPSWKVVAEGARLDGSVVRSGVSVLPRLVQAVSVRVRPLRVELTLEGGATVTVVTCHPSQSSPDIAHTRKAAAEIRAQVWAKPAALGPFNGGVPVFDHQTRAEAEAEQRVTEDYLLRLVETVRDACADRVYACKYDDQVHARTDLTCLDSAKLLAQGRQILIERGHVVDPIRNPSDRPGRVALVRKVLETVSASLVPNEALPSAAIRACLDRIDPEGLLDELDAESPGDPEPTGPPTETLEMACPATAQDVSTILVTLRSVWPAMTVKDIDGPWVPVDTDFPIPLELFVYRDHAAYAWWREWGGTPDDTSSRVHLIFGSTCTTIRLHPDTHHTVRRAMLGMVANRDDRRAPEAT